MAAMAKPSLSTIRISTSKVAMLFITPSTVFAVSMEPLAIFIICVVTTAMEMMNRMSRVA